MRSVGCAFENGEAFSRSCEVKARSPPVFTYQNCLLYNEGQKETIVDLYKRLGEASATMGNMGHDLQNLKDSSGASQDSVDSVRKEVRLVKDETLAKMGSMSRHLKHCKDFTGACQASLDNVRDDLRLVKGEVQELWRAIEGLKKCSFQRLVSTLVRTRERIDARPNVSEFVKHLNLLPDALGELVSTLSFYREGFAVSKVLANSSDCFGQRYQVMSDARNKLSSAQAALREKVAGGVSLDEGDIEKRNSARREAYVAMQSLLEFYEQKEEHLWEGQLQAQALGRLLDSLLRETARLANAKEGFVPSRQFTVAEGLDAVLAWWASRANTSNVAQGEVNGLHALILRAVQCILGSGFDSVSTGCSFKDCSDLTVLLDNLDEALSNEAKCYCNIGALGGFPWNEVLGAGLCLQQLCANNCREIEAIHRLIPELQEEVSRIEPYLNATPDAEAKVESCLLQLKAQRKEMIRLRAEKDAAVEDDDEERVAQVLDSMRPVKASLHQADSALREVLLSLCQLRETHFPELRFPSKFLPWSCSPSVAKILSFEDPHDLFDEMLPLQAHGTSRHKLWQASNEKGEWVLKEFPLKDDAACNGFLQQLHRLIRLTSPYAVPMDTAFYDTKRYLAYIQMPRLKCNVAEWLRSKPSAEKVRAVLTGTVHALSHAHGSGVVHGNLKPQNILLNTKESPALTDFDFGPSVDSGTTLNSVRCAVGTETFLAPEVRDGKTCSIESDMYSLGMIFGTLAPHLHSEVRKHVDEMVRRLQQQNPKARPNIEQVEAWLTQHGMQETLQTMAKGMAAKHEREEISLRLARIEDEWAQQEAHFCAYDVPGPEDVMRTRKQLLADKRALEHRRLELEAEVAVHSAYPETAPLGELAGFLTCQRHAQDRSEGARANAANVVVSPASKFHGWSVWRLSAYGAVY